MRKAEEQAAQAKAKEQAAARSVGVAHARFVEYVQATYIGGELGGTTGTLLTAKDPTQLLDHSALEQYQAQTKVDAIGGLQRATVVRSNAEAAARLAVAKTAKLKAAADAARAEAVREVAQAQAAAAVLQQTLNEKQNELDAAQLQYIRVYNDHQAYVKYVAYRAYVAAKARYQRYLAYKAEQARQAAIALAKARARAHRHHSGGGGGRRGWRRWWRYVLVRTARRRTGARGPRPRAGGPLPGPAARSASRTPGPVAAPAGPATASATRATARRTTATCSATTAPGW